MTPALMLHIGAGCVGIVSGAVALSVRKGGSLHRAFGNLFFFAMLSAAAMAAYLAAMIPQRGNMLGGAFTFYLVTTAWISVRREPGHIGRPEIGAFIGGLGIAVIALIFSILAAKTPTGLLDGVAPPNYAVVAALAALASALDFNVIRRGGIAGTPRIARHIWRMCVGLFIATGSFFLGQQKVMPAFVQGSPLLPILAIAPLVLMVFWLIRVRLARRHTAGLTSLDYAAE